MADANANIRIDVDTSDALSQIKNLQRQISIFHTSMAQSGKAAANQAAKMQANLVNSINATKGFSASMVNIKTATESFTNSLEKNKFSMGQYFRYAGASTKTFGKLFKTEFETIGKVARERTKDLQTQYIKMGRDANGAMKAIKVRPTTLDMKDLGTQTAIAAQKQQLFNQLVKQGSTNLLNWGKNTQWAGRQLMVGFTIPLTIMGATAAKEFMKLEEQAIKFKRVYGDMFTSNKETEQALANVRELAKEFTKFGVSVEETVGLAASVAQMGAMGADLTNQVTQATRLAVLGGIEQQEALDTTISLTNAFGLATEDLAGKIAFLNAAENQTILSIEDFNEAIPKAGSVVKQLGGDVEDLAYFLTAMREGGVNASQSANALKSSLARLINPTEVSREKLAGFGIDILGIVNDNAGNLRKTIQVLAVELDKLDPLNKSRAIEQLFGKFQFARMSTLFENIVKEGSQANKVLELTTNSTEELAIIAERELNRVSDSPMYKFKKAIEEFQVALAPIGEAFLKLATPLIEFGNRVMDQFNKLGDGTKQFIVGAVAIGGVVAPALIMVVGLIANAIANTIKFGLMIRNALNGATQSSDLLTDQYQYMNSEQIEAAAIAASLDQVHAKLRQTFTSEAVAVDRLVQAYDRAIAKQRQMMMSTAGKGGAAGKTPKGYNDGVVSVPGPKGAGDIVPAMLAPGEAVIPAKMAQKYGPLIQAMISGNIPGYQDGKFDFAHIGAGKQVAVADALKDPNLNPTQAVRYRMETLQDLDPSAPVSLKHSYGMKMSRGTNINLGKSGGAALGDVAREFSGKNIEDRYGEMFKLVGADGKDPQLQKEFANYDKAMSDKIKGLKKSGITSIVDSEEQWKQLPKAQQKTTRSLESLDKEVAKDIGKGNQKFVKVREKALGTVRDIRIGEGLTAEQKAKAKADPKRFGRLLRKTDSSSGRIRVGTSNQRRTKGGFGVMPGAEVFNDGLAEAAETKSPSKRTKRIAKDTVDGYANELERGKKKVANAGKKQSQAQIAAEESARRRSEAARKGWETRRANQQAAAAPVARGGRLANAAGRVRGMGGKLAGAGMAASSMVMAASMMPGQVGEQAQKLMMPIMGLSAVLPMLTSKSGLATVAIGALVTGIVMANMSFSAAQEKAMALTESLGGGSKAMEEFSKAAGKASAGEVMDKRRENAFGIFQIQPGKNTFGSSFMGSDAGQAMKADVTNSIKTQGSAATQKLVTNQLATAIAAGALDPAQARSIINSLSQELGDYSFGIGVNAELIQLLGPNGENLGKDPLKIRMEILKESEGQLQTSFENLNEAASRSLGDNVATGVGLAAGATAGALGGAIAGSFLAPFTGGLSVAIGAGVGALVGGVAAGISDLGGFIGSKISGEPSARERLGSASGASVAMNKIALQQQQEMIDSLDLEYEQRIANAEAAGDLEEVERLTNQRILDRAELLRQNQQLIATMRDNFAGADADVQDALMSGANKALEKQYKDTAMEDIVPLTQDLIKDNVADKEVQYLLTMQVASGEIGPLQMINFLETFEKGSQEQDALINVMTDFGGAFTNQTMTLLGMFEDDKSLQADLLLNIEATGDAAKADELLSFYEDIAATSSVLNKEATFKFLMANPAEAEKLKQDINEIKGLAGEITVDVVAQILNADAVNALNNDLDYFNSLSNDMKKIYLQTLVTTISTVSPNDPALDGWLNSEGSAFRNSPPGVKLAEYARYNAGIVTKIAADTTGAEPPKNTATGGGGGPKASVFDELTKKIRDLRLETFKAQKGWTAATKALHNLFKGGKESIDVFGGLANQMRKFGVGESMIEKILGMDPDEYEKRKGELFNFDSDGKISGLTTKFKSLAAAMHAVALGEYVNQQQAFVANTNNQFTAMTKLTAAGMSFVDAYDLVQDAALATAIAMAATNEEVEELIRITNLLNEAMDRKNTLDEEAAALKAVQQTNDAFMERYQALNKIATQGSGLSDDQITAILSDPNLTKLYLNPDIDPDTLRKRLDQAAMQANLELRVQIATEEGREQLFDSLMGDINDQFARKEQEIEVNFKLATEDDSDIVRDAQNKIAKIQYDIDDYQAELKGISDQEDAINEKYDKRYEALEKVASSQEKIARAQQAQLDIADALSRGDIAAAARAQQELQAQEAEAAREERRAQLERAQAAEIANVRSTSGKSRKELEDAIKGKQDEIFKIEEEELEPAEERIRLAEYNKAVAIDNLKISGRTRDEWEKIANSVDLATVNMEEFNKKIEQALALYEYFVNGKPLDASLFGQDELDALIESGQVAENDVIRQEEVTPEQVLGEDIVRRINEGQEVDETKLTERQLAAKNLYEVTRDTEGTMKAVRDRLGIDDKTTAPKVTMEMAKDLGIINKNGQMQMSADRAETVMQRAIEDLYKEEQKRRDREASAAYSRAVGTTSADRLDDAYRRDVQSIGLSTNIGAPQPSKTNGSDNRFTNMAGYDSKPTTTRRQPRPQPTISTKPAPTPQPAPRPTTRPSYQSTYQIPYKPSVTKPPTTSSGFFAMKAAMRSSGGSIPGYSIGGRVRNMGFRKAVMPDSRYKRAVMPRIGKSFGRGSDTVPAMLTPGEFVIRRPAVQKIGLDRLEKINRNPANMGSSVYNYNLAVNVRSVSDPEQIARTVMKEIRRVESQRVRGSRI